MSEEHLKAFLEAVKADEGLQDKLKAAGDLDAVVEIAKAAGFVISAEELEIAMAEVSEEELEGLAGGTVLLAVGQVFLGATVLGAAGGAGIGGIMDLGVIIKKRRMNG